MTEEEMVNFVNVMQDEMTQQRTMLSVLQIIVEHLAVSHFARSDDPLQHVQTVENGIIAEIEGLNFDQAASQVAEYIKTTWPREVQSFCDSVRLKLAGSI